MVLLTRAENKKKTTRNEILSFYKDKMQLCNTSFILRDDSLIFTQRCTKL